jgi:hypothetical protein
MRAAKLMFAFAFAAGSVLAGCGSKQEMTPPPPPLRPDPEPQPETTKIVAQTDCEPVDADHELKPMPFGERSIPESTKLSDQARSELKTAESAEVDRPTRESYITQAVDDFNTALKADPYNVSATYGLAAAYARIGRHQCALNLLTRIIQMRAHSSKRPEVEAELDKLLGRKGPLDADFSDMRKDDKFRALIAKMCEGTSDANCVYGGQTTGREKP